MSITHRSPFLHCKGTIWIRNVNAIDCSRIVATASMTFTTTASTATMMALTVASPLEFTVHGVNAMLLAMCGFVLKLSQPMHMSHLCQKERASANKIVQEPLISNRLGGNEFGILALDCLEEFLNLLVIRVMLVQVLM